MSRIYISFLTVVLLCGFSLVFTSSVSVAGSTFVEGLKKTADKNTGAGYDQVDNPMESIAEIVGRALSPIFIGVSFLIFMLYAGYTWMMARGNEQEVSKAKNIIIYAVIGLAVILGAYAIVKIIIPIWSSAISK